MDQHPAAGRGYGRLGLDVISAFGVLGFLALRFALASLALSPILLSGVTRRTLLVGGGIGLVLAMGYLFQTLGLHIALLSRYAAGHDAAGLTFAQILAMAVLFAAIWPFTGTVELPPREVWVALLVTGLLASAGAFYVQTFVQQRLPAARTAVILTMEPAFAALFGYWLAGDRLVAVQIFGAVLILSALAIGEILPVLRRGK